MLRNMSRQFSSESDSSRIANQNLNLDQIHAQLAEFCTKIGIDVDFSTWDVDELRGFSLDAATAMVDDKMKASRLVSKVRGMVRASIDPTINTPQQHRTSLQFTPKSRSFKMLLQQQQQSPTQSRDTDTDDSISIVDNLQRLSSMRSQGLLTDAEFENFKSVLLAPKESRASLKIDEFSLDPRKAQPTQIPNDRSTIASGNFPPPPPSRNDNDNNNNQQQQQPQKKPVSVSGVFAASFAATTLSQQARTTNWHLERTSSTSISPNVTPVIAANKPPPVTQVHSKPHMARIRRSISSAQEAKSRIWSFVVLGASGALARSKVFAGLFHLFAQGMIQNSSSFIGFSRTKMSSAEFREKIRPVISREGEARGYADRVDSFLNQVEYVTCVSYEQSAPFTSLSQFIRALETKRSPADQDNYSPGDSGRVFYFALPPIALPAAAANIKNHCWLSGAMGGINRVVIEKPFGRDLESSEALSNKLQNHFFESDLFRIDHYLGKELVQNILTLRFTNLAFASTWSNKHISNVTISFKEPFGVDDSGFDQSGILRDVIQNHLLQVLSIIAMEAPIDFSPESIRDEKARVLASTRTVHLNDVVLGQYVRDDAGNKGYRETPTVDKNSLTATFASLVLHIDNPRWKGVPFFLKAGKALNERKAEIRIQFHQPRTAVEHTVPNELVIRLQPDESIYYKINTKTPGLQNVPCVSELNLTYADRHSDVAIPEAYERLLLDLINGDHQNFVRRDELFESWRILSPVIHRLERAKIVPAKYVYGSRGPSQSDDMFERYGFIRSQGYSWSPEK